jgi:DNA-binding NtrC family response regulator
MSKAVLIVEDDPQLGESLKTILSLIHHEPHHILTLKEAKEAIDNQSWDVIISDYSLADGTGVEVINYAVERKCSSTLIISSGHERESIEEELSALNHVRWMSKPYTINDLTALID